MTVDRDAVLAETPHWFVRPFAPPFGLSYDKVAAAVRPVVVGVVWMPRDFEGLQLIAYGRYCEALSDTECRSALHGNDDDLARDIQVAIAHLEPFDEAQLDMLIRAVQSNTGGGKVRARSASEGWIITLLELVAPGRPDVIDILLQHDEGSHIVLRWLLQREQSREEHIRLAGLLMRHVSRRTLNAATAFLSSAAYDYIIRGGDVPTIPFATAEAQLFVSGSLLTEMVVYTRRSRLAENLRVRSEAFIDTLRTNVLQATRSAQEVRTLQEAAGKNYTTLLALIIEDAQDGAAEQLRIESVENIRSYFRPIVKMNTSSEDHALPYLAPVVMNDLLRVWLAVRAGHAFFSEMRSELRCDEYAYAYTYAHYLTDRRRAIVLASLGALAGSELGDDTLLQCARDLAADLSILPAGVVSAFDEGVAVQIAARARVDIPNL